MNKDNSREIAELVVDGVNINQQRKIDGLAAIHLAAMQGSIENLNALIALGADVNVRDIKGHSPLDFTSYQAKAYSEALINAGGKRYKKWGNPSGNIFFKGTRVFNVAYFLAIFLLVFSIIKIFFKKANAKIIAFSIIGLSYFFLILLPQIIYGGIKGLIHIDSSQYLCAFIPIITGAAYYSPVGDNKLIAKASSTIVNFYILGASINCFALLVLIFLISGSS